MKNIREAVFNAHVHRDWTRQEEIVVVGFVGAWGLGVHEGIIPLLPKVNGMDLNPITTATFLNVTARKRPAGDE